ncbi:MAG: endonuclease/exonuclease/phosphatase family protein [Actinobacteria bacterium]|nr:endonuclease/exonuclease/phosphatase family protein [Actinomycetota bacterium]MCB8996439.1 endonuclease/exonuclease/phosphatase family protein [Actinomycetota bacterium]
MLKTGIHDTDERGMVRRSFAIATTTAVAAGVLVAPSHSQPLDPPRVQITVATYNVCKVSCMGGRFSWAKRRKAIARTVAAAHPDVLAVQEAPTLPWRGTTQWADLTRVLSRRGYRPTSTRDGCSAGCTRGAHLYFDPGRVRLFGTSRRATGMESQRRLSGTAWGGIQDRNLSWAYLQDIASGGVFLAVSLHLPNEKTQRAEVVRRSTAAGVASFVQRLNAGRGLSGIPVIVMGDLNSYASRQPKGAQQVFQEAGFVDAFDAPERINGRYPTANYTPATRHWHGFPPSPFRYSGWASRIDYVLAANGVRPRSYEVFLKLRADGRFDNRFRGSDHNLVRARLSIPVVAG